MRTRSTLRKSRLLLGLIAWFAGVISPALAGAPFPKVDSEIVELSRQYVDAYRKETRSKSGSRLLSTLYSTKIQTHLYSHIGSEQYINELTFLDSLGGADAQAIFDLARKLQFHWEARYAAGIGQRAAQRKQSNDIGTKAGASVGMLALGVLLVKSPQNAPRYFRILRHLLPLAGAITGRQGGAAYSEHSLVAGDTPPAPAHIMRLGLASEGQESVYGDDQLYEDFIAISSGLAAGSMVTELWTVVRAARAINVAATPAKINPLVLAGSLVVGLAVEQGVRSGIENYQESELRQAIANDLAALDRSIREQDQAGVLLNGEKFKRSVVNLAIWMWSPIIETSKEFEAKVSELGSEHAIDSPAFATELESETREFRRSLRTALSNLDSYYDPALESHVVLSYLRTHNEEAIASLASATARTRAQSTLDAFDSWLGVKENEAFECFEACTREKLFQEFLSDVQISSQKRLVTEFRKGTSRQHPSHLLLQGAAILSTASYGKDILGSLADELLALVDKNEEVQIEAGFFR